MQRKLQTLVLLLGAYLVAPVFGLLLRRRRWPKESHKQLKILVFPRMTRVGDMVCATPVFRAIKERYPEARLTVFVSTLAAGIIRRNPRIDELIIYEESGVFLGFWGAFRLFKKIRHERYDWAFILTNNVFHTFIAYFGLIPRRVKTKREQRGLVEFLTDWFNTRTLLYRDHTYLPRHYLKLLEPLGIRDPKEVPEVFPTTEGRQKAGAFLEKSGVEPEDFLVGISVTAGNKIKEWGVANFAALADALVERYQAKIFFIGSPHDRAPIEETQNRMRRASLAATDFSLEELPGLMECLKLFISVDTGPLFVAHALGVPVVDIVGPIDPREQSPQDERSALVTPSGIAPSSFVMAPPGLPEEHIRAVAAIAVEDALRAVAELVGVSVLPRS